MRLDGLTMRRLEMLVRWTNDVGVYARDDGSEMHNVMEKARRAICLQFRVASSLSRTTQCQQPSIVQPAGSGRRRTAGTAAEPRTLRVRHRECGSSSCSSAVRLSWSPAFPIRCRSPIAGCTSSGHLLMILKEHVQVIQVNGWRTRGGRGWGLNWYGDTRAMKTENCM